MSLRLPGLALSFILFAAWVFAQPADARQTPPAASGARILLLPRRIVSGERATLAVLDVNGRLTPGVTVNFSNGDRFTTDATGRALFVAPLNPGMIYGSIAGRAGRVATTILSPSEATSAAIEVSSAPRVASLTDRFEILGKGFCGDADANQVTIAGQPAIVLASSPTALVVLPPPDSQAGSAAVQVSCANREAAAFSVMFVGLELEADSSPLRPGEHRSLTVRVRGTTAKIALEARNLAPEIAELSGGNLVRGSSSGGAENLAKFEVLGRKNGSFLISIRLVPSLGRPLLVNLAQ
jgi:IPT/TIG domain